MFSKRQIYFKRNVDAYTGKKSKGNFTKLQTISRVTYYFLFIPVFFTEEVLSST